MGTEVESGGVVLPKIASSPFLVNQDPNEELSENEDQEEDQEKQSCYVQGRPGGRGSQSISNGSHGNDSFVPKTLTSGSAPRPSGQARQFAERRIQHEEILRDPKAKRMPGDQKPAPTRSTNSQPQPNDENLHSQSTLRRDSADSGIASADKTTTATTATAAESSSSVHNSSLRTRSEKNQPAKAAVGRKDRHREVSQSPTKSQPPPSEASTSHTKQSQLARDDSGLLSNHSDSPQYPPPAGKALVYDKRGNLILRDRPVESGMSDPIPRKPKMDDQLKRIYYGNTLKPKLKEEKEEKQKKAPVERRGEVILTRREAEKWGDIHNVYGSRVESNRKRRHNNFMTRLELIQLEQAKRHNQDIINKNLRALERQKRQQDQLFEVRHRFDEEQRQRFYNQWVTTKNLQHEKCDRHVYGLPEEIYGDIENQSKLKRKKDKLVERFDFMEQRKKNAERFKYYLNVNAGGNFDKDIKMPKVEPPNNLDVDVKTQSGKIWKDDEKKLKDILNEAKREIKAVDSPRASEKTHESAAPPRQRPDLKPGKKEAAVKAKSSRPRPDFLETYGQKKQPAAQPPAPKKAPQPQQQRKSKPKPAPAASQRQAGSKPGQSSKRFQQVGTGAFQIGGRKGPRQPAVPESGPRRRLGSDTSLNTLDFLDNPADEQGLDAFERARIKYNLTVDSDDEA